MVSVEVVLTPLERIDRTIADLEKQQAVLLAQLVDGQEALQAARVDAMTQEPGKRATAAGAASPVYKLGEQLREADVKLGNVELDLDAARIARGRIVESLAEEARQTRAKANTRLRRDEQTALDACTAAARGFLDEYENYRVVMERRRDELGGGDEFQPVFDQSRARTAAEMFDALTNARIPELEERAQARPGAVIPILRSDPRWSRLSRPFTPDAGSAG